MIYGGNTYIQNQFFAEIKLVKYLKNIDSTIVGISAGSINAATTVFNSPKSEEDLKFPYILKGLELTNLNIEPHFNKIDNIIQKEAIIKESYKRKLYGLVDGSYIFNNTIYGECYLIDKGQIKLICENNKFVQIDKG